MMEKDFIGYEYQSVTVRKDMENIYADGYENFGWQPDGTKESEGKPNCITMKFKRDRKICNKTELTRLQNNFDACAAEIMKMEDSKNIKASITAYVVGIIGTGFMAGSVFAVTSHMIVPCVALAVPGFLGWAFPYFLYNSIKKKKTEQVTPFIEQKYDELYTICEKAHGLCY